MSKPDNNELDVIRKGFATAAQLAGATEGQVPAVNSDGDMEFVDQTGGNGGSQPQPVYAAINGIVNDYDPPGGIDACSILVLDPSAQPWQPLTAYSYDPSDADELDYSQCVTPTADPTRVFELSARAGVSGAVEPDWDSVPPVTDGDLEWTEGGNARLGITGIKAPTSSPWFLTLVWGGDNSGAQLDVVIKLFDQETRSDPANQFFSFASLQLVGGDQWQPPSSWTDVAEGASMPLVYIHGHWQPSPPTLPV